MTERDFPWSRKQIRGALVAAINDHGPIDKDSADSAAKRIVNQLYGASAPTAIASQLEAATRREKELNLRIDELESQVLSLEADLD